MKIGITGSNGFIGSHVYDHLKNKYDCEPFDRTKYDILNVESMKEFVSEKDYILHLAGSNRAADEELVKINSLGTICLLEAIRKYSNNTTKIIFSSSMQVYGSSAELKLFREQDTTNPINIYGLSKVFAEETVRKYYEWYGIKGMIYRMSNVYGPGCKPYYNSAISSFVDIINQDKTIVINGNGEQSRDFIYISDVVEAFSLSLTYNLTNLESINICTGKAVSINDVIRTIKNVTGKSIKVEYKLSNESTNYLIGDPSKASKIMGFTYNIDIEEGLKRLF
jgi:nucleoside-diphosphate-sugar epimerase